MIFDLNRSLWKGDIENNYIFYTEKYCTQCFASSYLSLPFNRVFLSCSAMDNLLGFLFGWLFKSDRAMFPNTTYCSKSGS